MSDFTLFHNPRCSKSRKTLQLLQDKGVHPLIRLYLDDPPTEKELRHILSALGISARELLRGGEDEYKALGLKNADLTESELITAMSRHPRLIERPIVISPDGKKAVLGRPPENALTLINCQSK